MGVTEGCEDELGSNEGDCDGPPEGFPVGDWLSVGESVGDTDGVTDGVEEGDGVILRVGLAVGDLVVGANVGLWVSEKVAMFRSASTITEKEALVTSTMLTESASRLSSTKIAPLKFPGKKKAGSLNGDVKLFSRPIRSTVSFVDKALPLSRSLTTARSSIVGFAERVRYRAIESKSVTLSTVVEFTSCIDK